MPKAYVVAVSFTATYDISRVEDRDIDERFTETELFVSGSASYDPNTKTKSDAEV